MTTKPWQEAWGAPCVLPVSERHVATIEIAGQPGAALAITHETHATKAAIDKANAALLGRASLVGAAPALARCALRSEWSARVGQDGDAACPDCEEWLCTGARHAPGCERDAALTAIGLPDQASRDAARTLLTECNCKGGILPEWKCDHEKARELLEGRQ